MADESRTSPGSILALTVSMSCRAAFVDTLEALAARVGEHAGCGTEDARRLGRALGRTVGGVVAHRAPDTPDELDISFGGNGRVVRVDVSCAAVAGTPDTFSLERVLEGQGDIQAIQALVDRVEFGRDGARQYCRLTHQIRAGR